MIRFHSDRVKKIVSFSAAFAICFSVMDARNARVLADSVSEIEAEIQANEDAIARKREELSEISEKTADAKEYLKALTEKINLQQNNIDIINRELADLSADIDKRKAEIASTEVKISAKKAEMDEDMSVFRDRLRSMYISGGTGVSEILTGASDFYDLLARYELISRVAESDGDMINDLNAQLDDYNIRCEDLNKQKAGLEAQKKKAEDKRDMLQGEMNALIDEYAESESILSELRENESLAESDIAWLDAQNEQLSYRIDEIKEQERMAAEQARREAEERRRQAEEERLRKEEEERLAAERAAQNEISASFDDFAPYDPYSYDTYDYSEPDYSYETYSGSRGDIVDYAKTYLGVYYQWCGNYPAAGYYGLDCSHFTYRVLEHFGLMDYYMDSRGQCSYCTPISEDELQPGDLVFYRNSGGRVEHVTMYIGNGQIIGAQGGDSWVSTQSEAESVNAKVKIVSLYSDGRSKSYGRVPGLD